MPKSTFHFKQFSIDQDRCAMKVGTDGVLLGAWAGQNQSPQRILDVGTGTGLIALMMAQRFPSSEITGIEIDEEAATQAAQNVIHSPFSDRIDIIHDDLFHRNISKRYDLIVCNPPFYAHAHPAKSEQRATARHGILFSIDAFVKTIGRVASPNAILAMVLPVAVGEHFLMSSELWYPSRKCIIQPTPSKPPHRYLIEWSRTPSDPSFHEQLVIETGGRHQYSAEYRALTEDFYLKF